MKQLDFTPELRSLVSTAFADSKDPVHAIRVACKKIRALLLLTRKHDKLLSRIKKIKNSLEEFRNQDVWIAALREIAPKSRTTQNENELRFLDRKFQKRRKKDMAQRRRAVAKAKRDLRSELDDLRLRGRFKLTPTFQSTRKAFCRYRGHASIKNAHDLRKAITLLLIQLEERNHCLGVEKDQKKIRRLKSLKNITGETRDLLLLKKEIKTLGLPVPATLRDATSKQNKHRKRILGLGKKVLK